MYTLVWTPRFTKSARKFARDHPDLNLRLADTLRTLEQDPAEPTLRLHPLKGKLKGLHAVSVTHSHRIVLTLKVTDQEIILLDIGTHDEVYR